MRFQRGIAGCIALIVYLLIASPVTAAERLAFEAFPAPGSEEEETGNLFVMKEGGEPQPLELWGQNPSVDTRGRLVTFYSNHKIYVTDYQARATRAILDLGPWSIAGSPQWLPGHGIVTDGAGDIVVADFAQRISSGVIHEVNWSGRQWAPAASPSGQRIAFLSETNPKGESLEGTAVFTANMDGSNPVQVTNPEVVEPVSAPTYSPDGSRIAFSGFGEFNEWEQGDIVSVTLATSNLTPLTNIPEGIAWEPDWMADGRILFTQEYWGSGKLEFLSVPEGGGTIIQIHKPFTGGEWGYHVAGRQPVDWGPLTSESYSLANQLLFLYAPTLKYDTTEAYRANSIHSIVEGFDGTEPSDSNALLDEEGEVIQYANWNLNPLNFRIWFAAQGAEYFTDPILADESHRLDERNGSYAEDAAPWQEDWFYGDVSYGRAVYAEGSWWLQYWLWYYYNDFNSLGFGDHEGDWELIQIQLGEYGNPQLATYAQHGDSEADTCNFDVLDWTVGRAPNVSPVIYPGTGTHASFIRPGLVLGVFPYDRADGEGYVARTRVIDMLEEFEGTIGGLYWRDWSIWPGRWGSSLGTGKSPMAPISQGDKWDSPGQFAEQAESCPREEEGTPQARVQGHLANSSELMPPRIRVRRGPEGTMDVWFRLRGPRAGHKRGVEVAVLAEPKRVTPTKETTWGEHGHLRMPLPAHPGPFTVAVRAVRGNGSGSRVIRRRPHGSTQHRHQTPSQDARPQLLSSSARRDVLHVVRAVRRLGAGTSQWLKAKEEELLRINEKLLNAESPVVVSALGDGKNFEGVENVKREQRERDNLTG